jgi:hypothetical protein
MKSISTTVCTYHRTFTGDGNKTVIDFKKQNFDNFFVLFDNQLNLSHSEVSEKYDRASVSLYDNIDFKKYNFDKPISKYHFWGNHQNPKYFFAHFRMLIHYINYPDFEYYWFFDDDVQFTGDLKSFLYTYNNVNDDFIAIQVFKKENYFEFPNVSVINNRMEGSRGFWLNHCPGPGDNFKNTNHHLGSFFPIVRFSNRSLEHLLRTHQLGYYGYSEGFVPTTLASDGFTVSSMMDEFNNFFLNNQTDCILTHKGQSFTWEWL